MKYQKHPEEFRIKLVREAAVTNTSKVARKYSVSAETLRSWIKKYNNPEYAANARILVISDLHIPYHHQDAFAFLKALHAKYKFTRIINIGDEVDNHAMSFHDSDPDLPSAGNELHQARLGLQELQRIFPVMDIIKSNHGDMFERKLRASGIPQEALVDRITMYRVEPTWELHRDLTITLPNGDETYFHHGLSANALNGAKERGCNLVQGHFHTKFDIGYWRNNSKLAWGMTTGCLIDRDRLAFLYAREAKQMQIIGCGGIIDSYPRLFPMRLNSEGRWNGELA